VVLALLPIHALNIPWFRLTMPSSCIWPHSLLHLWIVSLGSPLEGHVLVGKGLVVCICCQRGHYHLVWGCINLCKKWVGCPIGFARPACSAGSRWQTSRVFAHGHVGVTGITVVGASKLIKTQEMNFTDATQKLGHIASVNFI